MDNENKILAVEYVNASFFICIVLTENGMSQITGRIAPVYGHDEWADSIYTRDYGAKLTMNQTIAFFPGFEKIIREKWKYK